jgi:hypothetical protein
MTTDTEARITAACEALQSRLRQRVSYANVRCYMTGGSFPLVSQEVVALFHTDGNWEMHEKQPGREWTYILKGAHYAYRVRRGSKGRVVSVSVWWTLGCDVDKLTALLSAIS